MDSSCRLLSDVCCLPAAVYVTVSRYYLIGVLLLLLQEPSAPPDGVEESKDSKDAVLANASPRPPLAARESPLMLRSSRHVRSKL